MNYLTFEQLSEQLKAATCDCSEHALVNPVLDDLDCGSKSCANCGKAWFFCAFCKLSDMESAEELDAHISERHPEELEEIPMFGPDGDGEDD